MITTPPMQVTAIAPWFGGKRTLDPLVRYGGAGRDRRSRMAHRILIACEESGVVRDAFIARGFDAWSCDILPSRIPGKHIQGDVLTILDDGWDMMIAFPPCTHLAVSGARHFAAKRADGRQQAAIDFFMAMVNAPIAAWAIENPVGIMSTVYRKPDQIIQPWMFGHEASKATCLWLTNLPPLVPTKVVGRGEFITTSGGKTLPKWYSDAKGSRNCAQIRSATFPGIAAAMAD